MKRVAKLAIGVACLGTAMVSSAAEPAAPPEEAAKPAAQAAEDLSATAQPRVRTSPTAQPGAAGAQGKGQPAGPDRLELDTTIVSGNRELPKVLYIVPWKKADIGELPSQPFNSLLDEVLAPVDRDVFRREIGYYGLINGQDRAAAGSAAAQQQSAPAEQIRSEK